MSNVMPLEPAQCVLWDFDGTLAHREGMWSQCVASVVNREILGSPVLATSVAEHLRSGFPWHAAHQPHTHITSAEVWWSNLLPVLSRAIELTTKVSSSKATLLAKQVRSEYLESSGWHVYHDAEQCLSLLAARGWKHVILSNHVPELPELVEALGLSRHFESVISSANSGYEKPHAEAFGIASRGWPQGTRFVMVGDNYTADIAGAEAVGIPAVLVRKPHAGAKTYLASLEELPGILKAHNPSIERTC